MLKMGLNKSLYYIINLKSIAIEFQYLELIFKSRRSSVGIWKIIVLRLKGSIHFLKKKSYINSDIYIN